MSNDRNRPQAIEPDPASEPALVDSRSLTDDELRQVVGAVVANDLGPDNVQK